MKSAVDLKKLLLKYNQGDCSEEEKRLLYSWYTHLDLSVEKLTLQQYEELGRLQPSKGTVKRGAQFPFRMVAAAVLCICLPLLSWYLYQHNKMIVSTEATSIKVDPGSDKAILKLSNGDYYTLGGGDLPDIKINEQLTIHQEGINAISFESLLPINEQLPNLNTLTTPKGGQFRLTLPDGTKVWINAASSITFPTSFSQRERLVSVTGEVYFEVVKQNIPFKVRSDQQEVDVLGTHFSISAYPEMGATKTTLIEGAVKIRSAHGDYYLKPGQQCFLSSTLAKVQGVDAEAEIGWKDGDFVFNVVAIKQMMGELARWYNIDLNYDAYTDRGDTFTGIISRKKNLSSILQLLEKTKSVKFALRGRTLYLIN